MNPFDFWRGWDRSYLLAFQILASILLLLILAVLFTQVTGYSYFYDWQIVGTLQEVLYPVHSNHSHLLESTISTEISFLIQRATGGYLLLTDFMVYLFAGVVFASIMTIVSLVTYLNRFWFVVSMGLLVIIFAVAGFGSVQFLGLEDNFAVGGVSALFIVLAYYFHEFNSSVSMRIRFMAFILLFIGVLVIVTFINPSGTLLNLAYQAYWPALILAVVFAFLVGHEIVYAILILTTQDARGATTANTPHFVVLSLVYLLNVGFVYMRNAGYIDWDFYYLNVFFLLSVSTVLGFWGLKGREELYRNILPFYPYTALLYSALGVICYASIFYFILTGNDPSVEVMEDAIVFGHIGFGGMFFIYIIVNFISLMIKNLPVYRVAFKEDNFPYATSKLGGMIIVAAFFFGSNYAPFTQAVSGYLNSLGDMNLSLGNINVARGLYLRGSTYGNMLAQSNNNHKSNYMLATMETNPEKAIPYWKNASQKRPTDFAFASLGNSYEEDNRFFDAMFTYQKGLKEFPDSWALKNNLSLLYNRTEVIDSVWYYLNQVEGSSLAEAVGRTNILAVSAIQNHELQNATYDQYDWLAYQNNLLGFNVYQGVEVGQVELDSSNPALNLFTFCFLKNLGLASIRTGSMVFLKSIDKYLDYPLNGEYKQDLLLIKGLNQYQQGMITQAFETMLSYRGLYEEEEGKINALLGKWAMELNEPYLASKYFELSREAAFPWATADLAQAYALIDQRSVGQFILNNEVKSLDSTRTQAAERLGELEEVLKTGEINWSSKYQFTSEKRSLARLMDNIAVNDSLEWYDLAIQNPFFTEGVIAAVGFFNGEAKDPDKAYEILQSAVSVNQYNEIIIKSYIDQCLKMGLINYAENIVLRLYEIMSPVEFGKYEVLYEVKKSEALANLDSW